MRNASLSENVILSTRSKYIKHWSEESLTTPKDVKASDREYAEESL